MEVCITIKTSNMNIHEDIEREAEQYVATIVNPELESALPLILYAYKKAATAERDRMFNFFAWLNKSWQDFEGDGDYFHREDNDGDSQTDIGKLFQIFLLFEL